MKSRLYIDGNNIVRSNPSLALLEQRDGAVAARDELLTLVRRWADRHGDWDVELVFDGGRDGGGDVELFGPVTVRFAWDRSADELILDSATHAVSLGAPVRIASSDRGVRVPGAAWVVAEDFYDELARRPKAAKPVVADQPPEARGLVAHLAAAGHIPASAKGDRRVVDALAAVWDYYVHSGKASGKVAKQLEVTLREVTKVTPDPDPEKQVLRAVKAFLDKTP